MTGVMRRFSAALAAAAMAVSIVPFADISAYAEYAATHPEPQKIFSLLLS